MRVKDSRAQRLALAAVAAGILLLASIGYAVAGGISRSAHRVPTIVTDRPLQSPEQDSDAALAAAEVVEPPAIIETVTIDAKASATAASSGSSSKAARTGASAKPRGSSSSSADDADDNDDEHEVVRPAIRDEDSDGHDDTDEDRSND